MDKGSNFWDVEIEEGVISSLILRPENIDNVVEILNPEDFHDPICNHLYHNIKSQYLKTGQVKKTKVMMDEKFRENHDRFTDSKYIIPMELKDMAEKIKEYKIKRIVKKSIINSYDTLAEADDLNKALSKIQDDIFAATSQDTEDILLYDVEEVCLETLQELLDRERNEGTQRIKTNMRSLDAMLNGGLSRKHLSILAGRTSMGKTAFALRLVNSMLTSDRSVLMVSLEMDRKKLLDRMMIQKSKVASDNYYATGEGGMTENQRDQVERARSWLSGKKLTISDKRGLSSEEIKSLIRKAHTKQGGLDLVVIDYLTEIKINITGNRDDKKYANVVRDLRNLAGDLDCHIILIHQINRQLINRANKRPQLTDLRDSGEIEEKADNVIFVHRPEYYAAKEQSREEKLVQTDTEIMLSKQREGRTGTIFNVWYSEILFFQDNYDYYKSGEVKYFGGEGGIDVD